MRLLSVLRGPVAVDEPCDADASERLCVNFDWPRSDVSAACKSSTCWCVAAGAGLVTGAWSCELLTDTLLDLIRWRFESDMFLMKSVVLLSCVVWSQTFSLLTVLRAAAVASVAAQRLQIHFILVSSWSWTWQLRWSCRHQPQPGCRSVAVVNNTNSAAQRIKMDPAGCMRWHRLWKRKLLHVNPLPLPKPHIKESSPPARENRDIYRSRLCVSSPTSCLDLGLRGAWHRLEVTMAFCGTQCWVRHDDSLADRLTLKDWSLHGAFRDCQQGLKTLLQRRPGETGRVDLNKRKGIPQTRSQMCPVSLELASMSG